MEHARVRSRLLRARSRHRDDRLLGIRDCGVSRGGGAHAEARSSEGRPRRRRPRNRLLHRDDVRHRDGLRHEQGRHAVAFGLRRRRRRPVGPVSVALVRQAAATAARDLGVRVCTRDGKLHHAARLQLGPRRLPAACLWTHASALQEPRRRHRGARGRDRSRLRRRPCVAGSQRERRGHLLRLAAAGRSNRHPSRVRGGRTCRRGVRLADRRWRARPLCRSAARRRRDRGG